MFGPNLGLGDLRRAAELRRRACRSPENARYPHRPPPTQAQLSLLAFALLLLWASPPASATFSWKDCAGSSRSVMHVKDVALVPEPVAPGTTANFSIAAQSGEAAAASWFRTVAARQRPPPHPQAAPHLHRYPNLLHLCTAAAEVADGTIAMTVTYMGLPVWAETDNLCDKASRRLQPRERRLCFWLGRDQDHLRAEAAGQTAPNPPRPSAPSPPGGGLPHPARRRHNQIQPALPCDHAPRVICSAARRAPLGPRAFFRSHSAVLCGSGLFRAAFRRPEQQWQQQGAAEGGEAQRRRRRAAHEQRTAAPQAAGCLREPRRRGRCI